MGRLRTLAQTFRDFATNHVEEPDVSAVADGDDGYAISRVIPRVPRACVNHRNLQSRTGSQTVILTQSSGSTKQF